MQMEKVKKTMLRDSGILSRGAKEISDPLVQTTRIQVAPANPLDGMIEMMMEQGQTQTQPQFSNSVVSFGS